MQRLLYISFIVIALILSPAARAEQNTGSPFKGGMNYTSMKKRTPAAENERVLPIATPTRTMKNMSDAPPEAAEEETTAETPAERAWEKYKALAAGTYKPQPGMKTAATKKEEAAPEPASAEKKPDAPPTGMAGIIEKYHKNKAQQSEIHVLRMTSKDRQEILQKHKEKQEAQAPNGYKNPIRPKSEETKE